MGANFYGPVKWHCYYDCQMSGCPGHEGTLAAKHGGYYIQHADGTKTDVYSDIRLIDAVSWALWKYRGLVES